MENRRATVITCMLVFIGAAGWSQKPGEEVDMKTMMERARQFTQVGPEHELLQRFVGEWRTEQRITMMGAETEPEVGRSSCAVLLDPRWVRCQGSGSMMGMPMETFLIVGYDRFKKSYVTASLGTMDTALLTSEGDLDPSGKALITYGTLDEYLTGEHDKMVKYVWRFLSADEILMEIHDLPIGETNTKVVEMRYLRDGAGKEKGR